MPISQRSDTGPHIFAGSAQQLEDVQQLLHLTVSREERGLLTSLSVSEVEPKLRPCVTPLTTLSTT